MTADHAGERAPELVVAVGTTRESKLRAVRAVLEELAERFPDFLGRPVPALRLEPRSVPSGVPTTPRTSEASMRGARQRAERARRELGEEGVDAPLGIGLEGGLARAGGVVFLEAWAYVTDGAQGYFGSSGSIPLPEELTRAVMEMGEEMGAAADRYFGTTEVAAREGTFGVLTRMMVSREEAFRRALLHALAPFYNAGAYRSCRS